MERLRSGKPMTCHSEPFGFALEKLREESPTRRAGLFRLSANSLRLT
jgi:hypothetical protein